MLDMYRKGHPFSQKCADYNRNAFDFLKRHNIKHVFMIGNWVGWTKFGDIYFEDKSLGKEYAGLYDTLGEVGLRRTIDQFIALGITPYFVIAQPTLKFEVPHLMAVEKKMGVKNTKTVFPAIDYRTARGAEVDPFIQTLKGTEVVVIDMAPLFCASADCITTLNDKPLYMDANHLSLDGARYVEPLFEPYFKKGFSTP